MSKAKLIVGMPAGSLANPERGGSLVNLLKDAGFPTKGYDQGGPTSFPLTSYVIGWDGRPQEFGSQLAVGEVDIAISGDDWIRERQLELKYEHGIDFDVRKVLSLGRGNVRVVIINADEEDRTCDEWLADLLSKNKCVSMVSEMPYLALDWFQTKAKALGFGESHGAFSVQKFKSPPKIESGIVIYETWGKTEAKVKNGSVDFGLEITQTGSAIRNYGLCIVDTVLESEAGVWASPAIADNKEKYELARMFLLNLYGAVYAEYKVLMLFNGKMDNKEKLLAYLEQNQLFANEPTVNEGINYVEFSIQLDANSKDLPLARVRYELALLGATGIETIPLESSIPGLDVLDF
jgi:ATP phosphoribosyltransferase